MSDEVDWRTSWPSALKRCRRLRGLATASLIMVTARQDLRDRVNAFDFGANDYLGKPLMIEELRARMRAVVWRARQGRAAATRV